MEWLIAGCVSLAVWLALWRAVRIPRRSASSSLGWSIETPRWWSALAGFRSRRGAGSSGLGLVFTQVASRLRSGQPPQQAWLEELGQVRRSARSDPAMAAAVVATRMANHAGVPLAEVLDSCAGAVAEAEAAAADRDRARAGPITTARILAGLPLATMLIGILVGVNPLAGGGLARMSLAGGGVAMLAGWWWIHRLVAASRVR